MKTLDPIEPGTEVQVLDGVVAMEATVLKTEPAKGALEGHSEYDLVTFRYSITGAADSTHRKYVFVLGEELRMADVLDETAGVAASKARQIREEVHQPIAGDTSLAARVVGGGN